ncbi:hypothetical protein ISCGN_023077 [Ixodes scapularis]
MQPGESPVAARTRQKRGGGAGKTTTRPPPEEASPSRTTYAASSPREPSPRAGQQQYSPSLRALTMIAYLLMRKTREEQAQQQPPERDPDPEVCGDDPAEEQPKVSECMEGDYPLTSTEESTGQIPDEESPRDGQPPGLRRPSEAPEDSLDQEGPWTTQGRKKKKKKNPEPTPQQKEALEGKVAAQMARLQRGETNTVLVHPLPGSGQFHMGDKILIARVLSLASEGQATAVRVNTRKNVAAVDTQDPAAIEKLLRTTVVQNITVRTHLHIPQRGTQGVAPITDTRVFDKGRQLQLHFDGPRPRHGELWGMRLPVLEPRARLTQCGGCGRLGHLRAACTDQLACTTCKARHGKGPCPSTLNPTCPNCGNPHGAFDRRCPAYQHAKATAEIAARNGGDWSAASREASGLEPRDSVWSRGPPPTLRGRANRHGSQSGRRGDAGENNNTEEIRTGRRPKENCEAPPTPPPLGLPQRPPRRRRTRWDRPSTPAEPLPSPTQPGDTPTPTTGVTSATAQTSSPSPPRSDGERKAGEAMTRQQLPEQQQRESPGRGGAPTRGRRERWPYRVAPSWWCPPRVTGSQWNPRDVQEICRRIPTDSEGIICGDFNAHSESWGDGRMTQRGAALQAVLDDLDLVNLTQGAPTYVGPCASESVIDPTLVTRGLRITATPAPDSGGSDHRPIIIGKPGRAPQKRCSVTNWDEYQSRLKAAAASGQPLTTKLIKEALEESTKSISVPCFRPNPDLKWWDHWGRKRKTQILRGGRPRQIWVRSHPLAPLLGRQWPQVDLQRSTAWGAPQASSEDQSSGIGGPGPEGPKQQVGQGRSYPALRWMLTQQHPPCGLEAVPWAPLPRWTLMREHPPCGLEAVQLALLPRKGDLTGDAGRPKTSAFPSTPLTVPDPCARPGHKTL